MSRSCVLSLTVFLSVLGSQTCGQESAPRVGERHGDFTLPNIADGQPISLSDFRGRKVLLIQFASW